MSNIVQSESRQRRKQRKTGSALLDNLPPPMVPTLIAFASHLAEVEVDYLVFMARKAVRLYDLLLTAGCQTGKIPVLSGHILDQRLTALAGKRVAIVDDTLILGTTIAEAERALLAAGASQVIKIVFAIDSDNWCRSLVTIDKYFVSLTADEMLNFCASEVEALALSAIPYLTDFPVSTSTTILHDEINILYSLPGWDSFSITDSSQDSVRIYYYSHLPANHALTYFSNAIGTLASLVDIVKIRSFVYWTSEGYVVRNIPIVTLFALQDRRIDTLFEGLIEGVDTFRTDQRDNLRFHLNTPAAKVRFLQHFLGLVVGEGYHASLNEALGDVYSFSFDLEEAVRLFGPWLRSELLTLGVFAASIARGQGRVELNLEEWQSDDVPAAVRARNKEDIEQSLILFEENDDNLEESRNLFSDFISIFTDLHKNHELPAREEVHRLGRSVLDANAMEAPHRDRLKIGLSWSALVDHLCRREQMNNRRSRSMLLSLMLDVLVDRGIVVPILSLREGVLFRAYRHGEDVLWGNQESALAYATAESFLDSNGRSDIPRLTMEKLLVALLRVGVANNFLQVFNDLDGSARVARIGFHRHGAVATFGDEPRLYADDQDCWLSRHLVKTRVLKRTQKRTYVLGDRPAAAFQSPVALTESHHLGHLIGSLTRKPGTGARVVLDEEDLTLIATCITPRDATAAVLAELRIFRDWFEDQRDYLAAVDFSSEMSCRTTLGALTEPGGYHAFHSAFFKLRGYREARPAAILARCAEHLRDTQGAFLAMHWSGQWAPVLAGATADQVSTFEPAIRNLEVEFLTIATGMFTMEMALTSQLNVFAPSEGRRHKTVCRKALDYLNAFAGTSPSSDVTDKILQSLLERCKLGTVMPMPYKAYRVGHALIDTTRASSRSVGQTIDERVRTYGRYRQKTTFEFALWYDIIDSLGNKSTLVGAALEEYRERVGRFKVRANSSLIHLGRDAQRLGGLVALVPNSLSSRDDEKNILFAKDSALLWMKRTCEILLRLAQEHGIGIRLLVLNADFAGFPPYCHVADPTVEGDTFWEYGSRVKKWVKDQEESMLTNVPPEQKQSIFWLGGKLSNTTSEFAFATPSGVEVQGVSEIYIDGRLVRTDIKGSRVDVNPGISVTL